MGNKSLQKKKISIPEYTAPRLIRKPKCKIGVFGPMSSGKTSLTFQFVNNIFEEG